MKLRCALYARYSSDLQDPRSIEDQLRLLVEKAEREGWKIIRPPYTDEEISGSSMLHRLGIQNLKQGIRDREFDIVLAEALDRISCSNSNMI